jgi:hypothetical protein
MFQTDQIQYNYIVFSQRDKQNYAWTIARGTNNYNNGYGIYHWIKITISNGEFTIYYPAKETSVGGATRIKRYYPVPILKQFTDEDPLVDEINAITASFIRKSKEYLKIFNDNYSDTSLRQLNQWSKIVFDGIGIAGLFHTMAGLPSLFEN